MNSHDIIMIMIAVIRVVIAGLVSYKLLYKFHSLNRPERAGLCLLGGSGLLTIPPTLSEPMTPFDDWSALIFSFGILLYLIGRVARLWYERHHQGEGK